MFFHRKSQTLFVYLTHSVLSIHCPLSIFMLTLEFFFLFYFYSRFHFYLQGTVSCLAAHAKSFLLSASDDNSLAVTRVGSWQVIVMSGKYNKNSTFHSSIQYSHPCTQYNSVNPGSYTPPPCPHTRCDSRTLALNISIVCDFLIICYL